MSGAVVICKFPAFSVFLRHLAVFSFESPVVCIWTIFKLSLVSVVIQSQRKNTEPQKCPNSRRILLTNSFEGCDKKPVCFGTNQDFLSFDGGQVCPEGHAYTI